MSVRRPTDLRLLVASVTIAALAAVLFLLLLSSIARPRGLQLGLADASEQVNAVQTKLQSPGDPYAFGAHALCREQPDTAIARLRARLAGLSSAGLTLTDVSVSPGVADEAAGGVMPITLQFIADGRYDTVLSLLDGLAKSEPEIFVDTADLKSETSAVALKFSGRIYCSPSVPL